MNYQDDKTQAEELASALEWIARAKQKLRENTEQGYHAPSWPKGIQTMLTYAEVAISNAEEAE